MKKAQQIPLAICLATMFAVSFSNGRVNAADGKENVIEDVMKTYHKAPKGTDPVCKKAIDGKASPEELKKLVAAYKTLLGTKAPKGDEASWKEKTTKLYAAAQGLEKGGPEAIAKYKDAVNCKACHSAHKPD